MHKLIYLFFLMAPLSIDAKSFTTAMSPCDIGSNCKNCYEKVQITYSIDINNKRIIASGKDNLGKKIEDEVNNCTITNADNWSCDTVSFVIQTKNSNITIQNKSNSSLARNNKEICLLK